jgi:hypothetical protein
MVDLSSGGFLRNVAKMQHVAKPGAGALADRSDGSRRPPVAALLSRLNTTYPVAETGTDPATASAGRGQLAYLSRCAVLQAIGAAFIAGLWIAGIAGKPFEGDNAFLCWLIVAVAGIGITCLFLQRWRDVEWVATHVVRIGLLGTVIGLIIAFSAAKSGGSSDPDEVRTMIGSVVDGMYVSLYATLLGIGTNLWLKINLRLLGPDHG